ncbi:MAG: hypothetical protein WCI05_17550 [Myxococcales bacterium]
MTRLVHLGAVRPDVSLIAIDPDSQSPLPKLLGEPGGLQGAAHPLKNGSVFAPFDLAKFGETTFDKLFVDAQHPREQEVFESMFDADMAGIPVHKGMYGTPCVGATVFAEGANGAELQNLLKPLGNAGQVIVCGSVVGGTGAGVMHKLVGEVRRYYKGEMYGVFLLPWFTLPASSSSQGAITDAILSRNAAHGLKYFYEHTIPQLTLSLLVGYPGTEAYSVLRPLQVTDGDMGEHPHYLHLAAAWGLTKLNEQHVAHRGVKACTVAHNTDHEGWLLDEPWEGGKPLREIIRAHRVLLKLLEFLTKEVQSSLLDYYSGWSLTQSRAAWGDDLHQSIKNTERETKQQKVLVQGMLQGWEFIAKQSKFCVDWAQRLFPEAYLRLREGDPLLDALMGGPTQCWAELQRMWKGKPLAAKPHGRHTSYDIAWHHAQCILQDTITRGRG